MDGAHRRWSAYTWGLMALIAFILPVAHQGVTFERRKAGLAWLNVGYNGVALIGQAVVIAAWGA